MSFRFPLPLETMLFTRFNVPPRNPEVESKSPSILSNNLKLNQNVFEFLWGTIPVRAYLLENYRCLNS